MVDLRSAMMAGHFSQCKAEGRVLTDNECTYALRTFPIGDSYDGFVGVMPGHLRISDAPEELHFHYFLGELVPWRTFVVTSTGLRAPAGWTERTETDCKGNKRIPRILLKDREPYCDVFIPYTPGRMYVEAGNFGDMFDLETGLPFEVIADEIRGHTVHFWYNLRVEGDTSIVFTRELCRDKKTLCTFIYADNPRGYSEQENHIRLVEDRRKSAEKRKFSLTGLLLPAQSRQLSG